MEQFEIQISQAGYLDHYNSSVHLSSIEYATLALANYGNLIVFSYIIYLTLPVFVRTLVQLLLYCIT